MRHRPPPHIADRAVAQLRRHGLVWLLLLALPLHGLSAALIGLIGQRHFHDTVSAHALGRALWQADADTVDADRHAHQHSALQRHRHERSDAAVIALDPLLPESGLDAGTSGAAPSMLAPPPVAHVFARDDGHVPWSLRDTGWFVSWSSEPLERPPKA
jgi:hypothetical protein